LCGPREDFECQWGECTANRVTAYCERCVRLDPRRSFPLPPRARLHGTRSAGAELLFQVLTEREEKNSVAIASNESFGGWTKTFTDPRLCAAIVDRLTFNGTIIETGTDS
jgi:hypothetical protein